jgi:hypothetical protein
MAYLNLRIQDYGLIGLQSEVNVLHICSQEPASFADVGTYTLGNKTGISIAGPFDGTGTARKVTVQALTAGAVTATGTATHWALVDTVAGRLWATNALGAAQAVTSGNEFNLASFDIALGGL